MAQAGPLSSVLRGPRGAAAAALLDEALPRDRGGEAAWHGDRGVLPTLATGDEPGQVGLRGTARAVTP